MSDDYLNKPFGEMSDDELRRSREYWIKSVNDSAGWASACQAAKYLKATVNEGNRRGLGMTNPHPIIKG